jgi:hypothetical protein
MAPQEKDRAISTETDQAGCRKAGGVWVDGQCVLQAMVTMAVFKGNPCENPFITRIVNVSNPAQLRTLMRLAQSK